MSHYYVEFTRNALKTLKKMDKNQAVIIMAWIKKNLMEGEDLRAHGKALVANHASKWRYRIGDYRLISYIDDEKVVVLLLDVGHRLDIY